MSIAISRPSKSRRLGQRSRRGAAAQRAGRRPTRTKSRSPIATAGWPAATLLVYGPDCREKAEACGEIILERCKLAGFELARTQRRTARRGAGVPGAWFWRKYQPPGEVVLRVTAHDPRREAVECFARQFAPLITSGPAGLAGYAAGRPQVRPVFAYWPTLVPKSRSSTPVVEVRLGQGVAAHDPRQNDPRPRSGLRPQRRQGEPRQHRRRRPRRSCLRRARQPARPPSACRTIFESSASRASSVSNFPRCSPSTSSSTMPSAAARAAACESIRKASCWPRRCWT